MLRAPLTLGVGLSWLFAVSALAQEVPVQPGRGVRPEPLVLDKAQLERRFTSVGYLLEKSSVARQVEVSGDASAIERRVQAQQRYRQAQEAFKAENLAEAARLLAETSKLIMQGARLAAPTQISGDKQRSDFNTRLASVKMLLAADERISTEKHAAPEAAEVSRTVEKMIAEATGLADAGKLAEGRAVLDRAYLVARAAVSSMRSGDTLTRSVNFASKEEEYRYEIERNNTHQALIQSLLAQMSAPPGGALKEYIDEATRLRGEAEPAAVAGDHAAAVHKLEESTRRMLRGIRSLGIFVPGQD